MNEFITIKEACFEFPITRATLYRKFDMGLIKRYKFGGKTLIKKCELINFIKETPIRIYKNNLNLSHLNK